MFVRDVLSIHYMDILSLQAFSLADEKEETTPEEGLLAMSLLKHQVNDTL